MSWFDLVAGRLGLERRPEAKARPNVNGLQIPYAWPAWRAGQPDWTPATLQGYAEAGYEGNSLVLACIRRRAQSAAFAPLVAYTGQRAEPQRLPDEHPLAQLLRRPNPYQSWYEFMEQGITYLDLDGNQFIFKAGGWRPSTPLRSAQDARRQGFPSALYLLRSDRVRVVPGRERGQPLLGYVYDADDSGQWLSREPFLPEEIIHVKYPNPRDPFEGFGRGTSPLGAAAKLVDVDNAATSFLKTFFDQGVVPYGLLKSKQTLVDEEVQRIRDRLKAQYAGQQNWGETLILDADADYQRMGMSFQEMTFDALDARNEARICQALDVPPILVGAKVGLDRATYCLPATARVWTPAGSRRICEVKTGDQVWTFNGGTITTGRVVRAGQTGEKLVYRVRTKNRTLNATDNHPVLVRTPGRSNCPNGERSAGYAWRSVADLRVGDYIVQVKALPDQGGGSLPDGSPADISLLQFLGALIGDGTVTEGVSVCMSFPKADRCVAAYRSLAQRLFTKQAHSSGGSLHVQGRVEREPVVVRQEERSFRFSSAAASRWLSDLGFGGRAHSKRIPGWVYGLRRDLRLAFAAGLVDSDGSIDKRGALAFGFCNQELAEDVRDLLIGLGIQCSNLDHQRLFARVLPQPGKRETYDQWRFVASSAQQVAEIPFTDELYRERVRQKLGRHKADGRDAQRAGLDAGLGFYRVVEIAALSSEPVFDLEVAEHHAFIADGVVVHNSNYEQARTAFWQDGLIPGVYQRVEDALDAGLSADGAWVAYDYSNVPALREDESKKEEAAVRLFLGGVARRNEARAKAGLEPVEIDGFRAADKQQVGAPALTQTPPTVLDEESDEDLAEDEDGVDETASGLDDDDDDVTPGSRGRRSQADDDDEAEDEKSRPFTRDRSTGRLTPARRSAQDVKALDEGSLKARLKIERAGAAKVTKALRRQLRLALPKSTTVENVWEAVGRLDEGQQAVSDAIYQMMRAAAQLGLEVADAQVEGALHGETKSVALEIDWTLVNAQVLEWLKGYLFELVSRLQENSREALRAAITRWVDNGLPLQDLIDELTPLFGERRAEMIASTEVTRAFAMANMRYWQASGVVEAAEWTTVNDERVCPVCAPLGGLVFGEDGAEPATIAEQEGDAVRAKLGEAFVHPGGRGKAGKYAGRSYDMPPAHPRCRCFLRPVV